MDKIWEKYGKTEAQWKGYSEEARQRFIERQGKERKPSAIESEVKAITGTRVECVAGHLGSQSGEVDSMLAILKKCLTGEKMRDLGFAITNYVTREMKFDNINEDVVREIAKLSVGAILKKVNSQVILLIPVTPLNFIDVITGHPGLRTKGTNGANVIYHSGGGEMELPLANRKEAFARVKKFLGFAGSSIRKQDYYVYDGNMIAEMLTYILLMNYKWMEGEETITATEKIPFILPPDCPKNLAADMEEIIGMVEDGMKGWIGKPIRLETYTGAAIGAKVYVAVMTSAWLVEAKKPTKLSIALETLAMEWEDKIFVRDATDEEAYKIWKAGVLQNSSTQMFMNLKDHLERSKAYREDFRVAAKLTRNWYTRADYVDIKERRWGAAHNIMSILDTLDVFKGKKFDSLELVGPDADDIALCLNFLEVDGKDPFAGCARRAAKKKGQNVKWVKNWVAAEDNGDSLPDDFTLNGVKQCYFYCAVGYNDEKGRIKVVDRIRDTVTKVVNAKVPDFVLMFSGHLSGLQDINGIGRICKEFSCGMKMIRHPRLQNDKVFYIIAKSLERDESFLRTWYDAVICATDNCINYTWAMFTGIKPYVDTTKYNPNLIKGMYVSLHLTDRGRGDTRGDRAGLDEDMVEIVKRQTTNDNNNSIPTEPPKKPNTGGGEPVNKKRGLGEEEPNYTPMEKEEVEEEEPDAMIQEK